MNTTIRDLRDYVNEEALKNDGIRHQIYDLYELFLMEIEDPCASVAHEAELCISDIQYLISSYKTNTTPKR